MASATSTNLLNPPGRMGLDGKAGQLLRYIHQERRERRLGGGGVGGTFSALIFIIC